MEVDKRVKVLHCFLFMRRFEQKLADRQVEFQVLWFMSSSQDHTKFWSKWSQSPNENECSVIMKRCSGLIETNPSEELKLAQNHFFDTWVGKTQRARINFQNPAILAILWWRHHTSKVSNRSKHVSRITRSWRKMPLTFLNSTILQTITYKNIKIP